MYIFLQIVTLNNIFCSFRPRLKGDPDLSNLCLFRHSKLLGEGPAMSLAHSYQYTLVVERDEAEIDCIIHH
jgi:hypothetical protein